MSELPDGWQFVSLGEIGSVQSGVGFPNEHQGLTSGDYPVYKVGDVSRGVTQNNGKLQSANNYVSTEIAKLLKGQVFEAGSTLFAKIGEALKLNRRGLVIRPGLADNNVMGYKSLPGINDCFIYYFLRTQDLAEHSRSTTVPSIRKGDIEEIKIALPPSAEQTRIAEKLEELLAQVDTLKARIDAIPALLKRFRQSVLAAAVTGRLTEDWRTENTGGDVTEQINEILGDRLLSSKSKKTSASHLKNEEYEIPKTWRWVSLDSLAAKIVDGTHHTPTYVDNGVPFISVKDIRDGAIDFTNTKFISAKEHAELCKRCHPEKGDLLITKSGTIGRTAIITTNNDFSLFVSVALVKPASKLVNMKFVDIALMKWVGEIDVSSRIVGSAIKNLHLIDMKVLAVPFAPLAEQTEIVRRVEQLFAFADQLEAKVASAKSRIDHLTQSILAKAFRGELVPQDPNDEPASVLLERIKTQRATAPKAKRGRKVSTL